MSSERDSVLHSWCVPADWDAPTVTGGPTAAAVGREIIGALAAVGWPLLVPATMETVPPPSIHELRTLRELQARTAETHRRPVALPVQE